MINNVYWSSSKVFFILGQILMKFEFTRQIFEKYSNIKFHENASSGSRVVTCRRTGRQTDRHTYGWTDRHDEAISCFSKFWERASKEADIAPSKCPNLTLRRLMSYVCGAPILDVSRSHTTTQHSR